MRTTTSPPFEGPGAELSYVLMPNKSLSKEMETRVIKALQLANFPMAGSGDVRNKNFGRGGREGVDGGVMAGEAAVSSSSSSEEEVEVEERKVEKRARRVKSPVAASKAKGSKVSSGGGSKRVAATAAKRTKAKG